MTTTPAAALTAWWASLDGARRADALRIAPGALLDEAVALELQLHGVHVPRVSVAWDAGGLSSDVVVHVQPRALTAFLAAAGAAAASAA